MIHGTRSGPGKVLMDSRPVLGKLTRGKAHENVVGPKATRVALPGPAVPHVLWCHSPALMRRGEKSAEGEPRGVVGDWTGDETPNGRSGADVGPQPLSVGMAYTVVKVWYIAKRTGCLRLVFRPILACPRFP